MPLLKRKRRSEPRWTIVQRKLLAVLEQQENRILGPIRVCELAGYGDWAWDRAIKDPRFVTRLNQLGVSTGKPGRGRPWKHEGHLMVSLAADLRKNWQRISGTCESCSRIIHGTVPPCDFPHKLERFVKHIVASRFEQERL